MPDALLPAAKAYRKGAYVLRFVFLVGFCKTGFRVKGQQDLWWRQRCCAILKEELLEGSCVSNALPAPSCQFRAAVKRSSAVQCVNPEP